MTMRWWLARAIMRSNRRLKPVDRPAGKPVTVEQIKSWLTYWGAGEELRKQIDRIFEDVDVYPDTPVRSLSGTPLAGALEELGNGMFADEVAAPGSEVCMILYKQRCYGILTFNYDDKVEDKYHLEYLCPRNLARRIENLERAMEVVRPIVARWARKRRPAGR